MPVIVKARKGDSTNDVIRKFKKASAASGIVQKVRDDRYYKKPSKIRSEKTATRNRLKKRARSLKKMKNIPPQVITRINQKLGKS
jgi:ribosomal protein S21